MYSDIEKRRECNRKIMKKYNSSSINKQKNKARLIARKVYPTPQLCSIVNCSNIGDRHHPDIWKALEIVWLCHKHHMFEHRRCRNQIKCKVKDCDREHEAKGLCHYHYLIKWRENRNVPSLKN